MERCALMAARLRGGCGRSCSKCSGGRRGTGRACADCAAGSGRQARDHLALRLGGYHVVCAPVQTDAAMGGASVSWRACMPVTPRRSVVLRSNFRAFSNERSCELGGIHGSAGEGGTWTRGEDYPLAHSSEPSLPPRSESLRTDVPHRQRTPPAVPGATPSPGGTIAPLPEEPTCM